MGYDAKGNLTSDGGRALGYDSENRLASIATPQSLGLLYDPLGRFRAIASSTLTAAFDLVGTELVGARINGGATTERYVFAPGVDEPLAGYDNAGALYFFHADERGSIVANSGSAGSPLRTLTYDEYGRPSAASSRFLYAGKMHFGGVNAYYNNARFYDYKLGRFLQPDPIGYGGGVNMYAYVKGDPVNSTDPSGLCKDENGDFVDAPTGTRICGGDGAASAYGGIASHLSGFSTAGPGGAGGPTFGEAYRAAGELLPGYGTKAVNVAADYLMGNASLGRVAVGLLYDRAALAQSEGRGYLDTFRLGTNATVDTLLGILKDSDVRAAMIQTFDRSFKEQREWGFWIGQRGNDYFAHKAQPGDGSLINIFEFRAVGSNIAFHTHPFLNLPQGLSGRDLLRADRNGILLLSLSPRVIDWADYRR